MNDLTFLLNPKNAPIPIAAISASRVHRCFDDTSGAHNARETRFCSACATRKSTQYFYLKTTGFSDFCRICTKSKKSNEKKVKK